MKLTALDHLVLTVNDVDVTRSFYIRVLGMEEIIFSGNRKALAFGGQKINLHRRGSEFDPKAEHPTPGSADLCFLTEIPLFEAMEHVRSQGVAILEGPVERVGACGPIVSFYFRDPDGNLIEVANSVTS